MKTFTQTLPDCQCPVCLGIQVQALGVCVSFGACRSRVYGLGPALLLEGLEFLVRLLDLKS